MKLYELIQEASKGKFAVRSVLPNKAAENEKTLMAEAKKTAALIKKRGKPWLNETNNGNIYFYRGYAGISGYHLAFEKAVRKTRQPVDTSKKLHSLFNYLINQCGKTANRSNAVFVTGFRGVAANYGSVYITIPISKFTYTWHTEFVDWTGEEDGILEMVSSIDAVSDIELDQKTINKIKKKAAEQTDTTLLEKHIDRVFEMIRKGGYKKSRDQLIKELKETTAYWRVTSIQTGFYSERQDSPAFNTIYKIYKLSTSGAKGHIIKNLNYIIEALASKGQSSDEYEKILIHDAKEDLHDQIMETNPLKLISDEKIRKVFCPGLKGDDGTLKKAMAVGNEVMVACDSVLAIHPLFYEALVLPLLDGRDPRKSSDDYMELLNYLDIESD